MIIRYVLASVIFRGKGLDQKLFKKKRGKMISHIKSKQYPIHSLFLPFGEGLG
ncbi:hypothetical protein IX326_001893 [Porphyromonas levii]|nr:hypothetical protein [Porphyromonas levii]MBR8802547.1 hypothetical protein [Porphyromonas levii]